MISSGGGSCRVWLLPGVYPAHIAAPYWLDHYKQRRPPHSCFLLLRSKGGQSGSHPRSRASRWHDLSFKLMSRVSSYKDLSAILDEPLKNSPSPANWIPFLSVPPSVSAIFTHLLMKEPNVFFICLLVPQPHNEMQKQSKQHKTCFRKQRELTSTCHQQILHKKYFSFFCCWFFFFVCKTNYLNSFYSFHNVPFKFSEDV